MRRPHLRFTPCVWIALAAVAGSPAPVPLALQARVALERELKAVFLVNFARYVEWPAGSPQADQRRPLRIAILGRDPFQRAIDQAAAGVMVGGRTIVVERIRDASRAAGYHVIFISGSEAARAAEYVPRLNRAGALTVSDSEAVARHGVAIALTNEQERVRFAVNLDAARLARLTIGSELLRLARSVEGQP